MRLWLGLELWILKFYQVISTLVILIMTPSLVKKKTYIERFNKQVINLHILKQIVIIDEIKQN